MAAAVAAVVVAAVVAAAASAAAPASAGEPTRDVRWEVGYMTVAPLGVSQKVWWRAMACALFLISSEKFGPPCLIFSSSFFFVFSPTCSSSSLSPLILREFLGWFQIEKRLSLSLSLSLAWF